MSFGLNDNGFSLKRFDDIKTEIENNLRSFWPDINLAPESVLGQLVSGFTKPHADLWEQLNKVYDSQNPSSALMKSLDDIVQYNGLLRLSAQKTKVVVGLQGDLLTVVPEGTLISADVTGEIFSLKNDTIITNLQQNTIYVKITTYVDGIGYTIDLDSVSNVVISTVDINNVVDDLVDEINNNASNPATATNLSNGVLKIVSKNAAFDTVVDANMIYYTSSNFESIETGQVLAIANSLVIIDTPVVGLNIVNNFEEGALGRGIETDAELRLRREQSLQIVGAGTLPSIISRIQDDVDGISTVKGFENRTDTIDGDGRPPHSIEIVVLGGVTQDIVDKLWEVKGGGIQTFGTDSGNITDSNGDTQTLYFSRASSRYIWVKATITIYSEEQFPVDGAQQASDIILAYGNTFVIGLDVIPQRFVADLYAIPGIENILIEIGETALPTDPEPALSTAIIPIGDSEIAVFDETRINIVTI